jgi:hypothetical protein
MKVIATLDSDIGDWLSATGSTIAVLTDDEVALLTAPTNHVCAVMRRDQLNALRHLGVPMVVRESKGAGS